MFIYVRNMESAVVFADSGFLVMKDGSNDGLWIFKAQNSYDLLPENAEYVLSDVMQF